MIKPIILGLAFTLLIACARPDEVVIETDDMVVYHAEILPSSSYQHQRKYEYWIRDSREGFVFWSDQKFNIGDKITIGNSVK